ncbi:MAG TPA: VWA domain-containing protein [Candidatus Acidoferrales bacterium]|nr:VWA domain-containing protein [Candidatus Acidoferrales bacterium]
MKCRAVLVSVLFLAPFVAGQQQPAKSVLHEATHLVHVSVIVTDKNGHPVTDLMPNDFVIKDRGRAQKIGLFSRDAANAVSQQRQVLPRNMFSDQPQYNGESPNGVTIVLLDNLNSISGSAPLPYEDTPFWLEDHALSNAKQRLIVFLKEMDPNERVAIYGLTDTVHVLCDFTCDRQQLLAVVSKYDATGRTQRNASELGALHTPQGADFDAHIDMSVQMMAALNNEARAQATMAALTAIAAHVANIPGRKNLLWITSNLPFSGQAIAAVLSRANIVAYPVDARGLLPQMPQGNIEGVMDADAYAKGELGAPPAMSSQPVGIPAMEQMADDTGGRAFVNANDLTSAIRSVVEESAVTYTLGFYVDPSSLDGKFHELRVQLTRPGLNIRYPKGYFAFKDEPATKNQRQENFLAAVRSPLDSAAIPLVVRAARMDQPADTVQIAGSIGLKNLEMADQNGTRNGIVDLYFIAQNAAGNILGQAATHLRLKLTEQQYQDYLKSGITFRNQVRVKKETAVVRIVVQDPATSEVGSVIIPLSRID